jgi:hypothetical protein
VSDQCLKTERIKITKLKTPCKHSVRLMCLTISLRLDLASKLLFVRVHACPCLRVMPHLSFVECSTRGNFSKLLDCTRSFLFKIDMFFMTSFSWQTRILRVKLSLRGKKSLSFDFVWNTTISYNTYSCKYPRNRAGGCVSFYCSNVRPGYPFTQILTSIWRKKTSAMFGRENHIHVK